MSSSSTCSQEHFSDSPVAFDASSGSDCGSLLGSCSPASNASGAAAPGTAQSNGVAGMLRKINEMLANSPQKETDNICNGKSNDSRGEVIPSGPRKPGQGCEEAHQAIMVAEASATFHTVSLRITLLAAGFIIGPIGGCVREISRLSGASIRSRTVQADSLCHRDCREFIIEGSTDDAVAHAMSIIIDAVNRYKTLCEGKCAGQVVPRSQHVAGVEFFYQPPPRSVVPFAACLKGHSKRNAATFCNNKDFVKDIPSSKNRGGQYNAPPPPPGPPSSFKAAVVGLDSSKAIEQEQNTLNSGNCRIPALRSSPLKRDASSPPSPLAGLGAAAGAGSASSTSTAAAKILSGHPMLASKLTKHDTGANSYSQFEGLSNAAGMNSNASEAGVLAAAAAAMGLPYVSFGSDGSSSFSNNNRNILVNQATSNGGDQQVLVPLNLLLDSQHHLVTQQVSQQQQATTNYSASEILSALTAQLQTSLAFENSHTQHAQQAQQAQHGTPVTAAPSSDSSFYGNYYLAETNNNNESSLATPFAAVTTPFQTTTGTFNSTTPSTGTATTTAAPSPISESSPASVALCGPGGGLGSRNASDTSMFGNLTSANSAVQPGLYEAFSTESDVSSISTANTISQLANAVLSGNGGSGSAYRSAFALPSFFHGDSPLSGTPAMSRTTSSLTDSMLSRDSSVRSLRTSFEAAGGGSSLSNTASGCLYDGFGSYVFPQFSSTTAATGGEQQQHQPPMMAAAALQQWDLLASNTNQCPESAAIPATPAIWEAQKQSSAIPSTSSPYNNSNDVDGCAAGVGGALDGTDSLYGLLPKNIWSLE